MNGKTRLVLILELVKNADIKIDYCNPYCFSDKI